MSTVQVWVVNTCNPGEAEPCFPAVFGTEEEADAYFDERMRGEWSADTPENEEGEPLEYPGDAGVAHDMLIAYHETDEGPWGQWEITSHRVTVPDEGAADTALEEGTRMERAFGDGSDLGG